MKTLSSGLIYSKLKVIKLNKIYLMWSCLIIKRGKKKLCKDSPECSPHLLVPGSVVHWSALGPIMRYWEPSFRSSPFLQPPWDMKNLLWPTSTPASTPGRKMFCLKSIIKLWKPKRYGLQSIFFICLFFLFIKFILNTSKLLSFGYFFFR